MTDRKWATKNIFLIRHAPVNLPYLYGQMDVEASYADKASFEWLFQSLPDEFTLISSDLGRCVRTAREILAFGAGHANRDFNTTDALREQHFGEWQGQKYEEIERADKCEYQQFWKDPSRTVPPGGESFSQMSDRVIDHIDQVLTTEHSSQNLVIVAHAGPIRALISHALELSEGKALSFDIAPASLTSLTLHEDGTSRQWAAHFINRVACG